MEELLESLNKLELSNNDYENREVAFIECLTEIGRVLNDNSDGYAEMLNKIQTIYINTLTELDII